MFGEGSPEGSTAFLRQPFYASPVAPSTTCPAGLLWLLLPFQPGLRSLGPVAARASLSRRSKVGSGGTRVMGFGAGNSCSPVGLPGGIRWVAAPVGSRRSRARLYGGGTG